MNGYIEQQDDSTPRQFQRAAYVISPFLISAVYIFIFPVLLLPFLYAIPSGSRQLRVSFLTPRHNISQFMWEMWVHRFIHCADMKDAWEGVLECCKIAHMSIVTMPICVPNFIEIGRYRDIAIVKIAAIRHLEFSKFAILIMWHMSARDSASTL